MGKIVFLFVCLSVLVSTGYALNCYKCESEDVHDCQLGSPKLLKEHCNLERSEHFQFCILKTVYDQFDKKNKVLTGCELISPLRPVKKDPNAPEPLINLDSKTPLDKNIEQCQSDGRYDVKSCEVCKTDYCNFFNSAPIHQNVLIFLSLPIWYFFVKLVMN